MTGYERRAASRPTVRMRGGLLRSTDQTTVAVLLLLGWLVAAACWVYAGGPRGRLMNVELAEPRSLDFRVDVNRAEWPELVLLPGIGQTLARRIVARRASSGSFRRPEDLLRVRGIGPHKLQAMRPFLLLTDSGESPL